MMDQQTALCTAGRVIFAAVIAAFGLFLVLANLAEPHRDGRLLFEAILFIPLLLCSLQIMRARRS